MSSLSLLDLFAHHGQYLVLFEELRVGAEATSGQPHARVEKDRLLNCRFGQKHCPKRDRQ